MVRTSSTHPLQIDVLPVASGALGLTLAPGKHAPSLSGPPWARDLEADIAAIRAWQARAVVSLVTEAELRRLGIPDLGARVEAAGMDWLHLPVEDTCAPDDAWWERWREVSPGIHGRLERGERVLVHCRAGLERTAMLAALVLMERGETAGAALAAIAEARRGARPLPGQQAAVMQRLPPLSDRAARIRACLMGGAIGDAMGAEIEFLGLPEIRARFPGGVDRLLPHGGLTGAITDDTQMTLFTAEGLIRASVRARERGVCHAPSVVHHAYLRWLATQGCRPAVPLDRDQPGLWRDGRLHARRAPGNTCLSALRSCTRFGERARNDSKGCGGVMRLAPAIFVEPFDPGLAADTSDLTHGHPTARSAAIAWAHLLRAAYEGRDLREAAERLLPDLVPEAARAIRAALDAPGDGRAETVEALGGGWIAEEAVAIALYAGLTARGFGDGVRIAVTHSGDSDSTGAMAGNLLGLMFPDEVMAHPARRFVECADLIDRLSRDLAVVCGDEVADVEAFADRWPGY